MWNIWFGLVVPCYMWETVWFFKLKFNYCVVQDYNLFVLHTCLSLSYLYGLWHDAHGYGCINEDVSHPVLQCLFMMINYRRDFSH